MLDDVNNRKKFKCQLQIQFAKILGVGRMMLENGTNSLKYRVVSFLNFSQMKAYLVSKVSF